MNMLTKVSIDISKDEERLIYAMQLLGDKTRFKIFKLLMSQDDLCVTDIAQQLSVSVSAVSQHFRNFELVGLVGKERRGQKICYMLKDEDSLVKELVSVFNKKR